MNDIQLIFENTERISVDLSIVEQCDLIEGYRASYLIDGRFHYDICLENVNLLIDVSPRNQKKIRRVKPDDEYYESTAGEGMYCIQKLLEDTSVNGIIADGMYYSVIYIAGNEHKNICEHTMLVNGENGALLLSLKLEPPKYPVGSEVN